MASFMYPCRHKSRGIMSGDWWPHYWSAASNPNRYMRETDAVTLQITCVMDSSSILF
jgi:hypothetical protein